MQSDTPVIAFVADGPYAIPLAVAIASLLANTDARRELRMFIVDAGISGRSRDRISRLTDGTGARIEWLAPPDAQHAMLRSLPIGYVGRSCYYKMFLPDLLGPEYPRIIYLDSDIVVEADITELWRQDPGDHYVLAVQDLLNPYVSSPLGIRKWRQMGRDAGDAVLNAGVLVINAAKWHREDVSRRLVDYLRGHYKDVQLCDQEAMNVVFRDHWGRLDTRWNVLPDLKMSRSYSLLTPEEHADLLARAYILHFCGPGKPTNASCVHPYKDRFFHYLDKTAWAGWRPSPWTVGADSAIYYARRICAMALRALSPRRADEPAD